MSSSFVFDAVLFFGYMAVLWFREDVFAVLIFVCLFVCLIVLFCFPKDESVRTLAHWLGVSHVHCLMLFLLLLLWCFASPACKISGPKDARTRVQTVHFPLL